MVTTGELAESVFLFPLVPAVLRAYPRGYGVAVAELHMSGQNVYASSDEDEPVAVRRSHNVLTKNDPHAWHDLDLDEVLKILRGGGVTPNEPEGGLVFGK